MMVTAVECGMCNGAGAENPMAERIPRTWNLEVQSEDSLGALIIAANDVRAKS
jgi:hypothetical protein